MNNYMLNKSKCNGEMVCIYLDIVGFIIIYNVKFIINGY